MIMKMMTVSVKAYSFVTVYCLNFIIFLCVTLKFFSVSFVPLLAPNPGDATASTRLLNRLALANLTGRASSAAS